MDGSLEVELAFDAHAATGESPTWSEREQALYWIDIEEPALHRLNPTTGVDESWEMPAEIGAFALCRSGAVIVALRTCLARLDLSTHEFTQLCAAPYNPLTHRFNDGKCDARGRLWIGTMHDPLSAPSRKSETADRIAKALHVFSLGAGLQQGDARAVIGNGIAWSLDSRTMYFTDSHARTIWRYDFDIETACLSSPRVFAQFTPLDGKPDGAAIDSEGFYWCALYGGGRVVRLSPEGSVEHDIRLPVSQPTMCAFGGADHATLYITSAAHGVCEPQAGGVFRIRPGVKGCPPSLFADA